MKTLTVKMPAFLASALVNGDTSGLECTCQEIAGRGEGKPGKRYGTTHRKGCDHYWFTVACSYVAPGDVVDTASNECASNEPAEAYFSWSCDLPGFALGADMLDYVVIYPEGK